MKLTPRQISTLIRLLGVLQTHLESAIESSLVPGTNQAMPTDADAVRNVRMDRRDWRIAEDLVKKLDHARHANASRKQRHA